MPFDDRHHGLFVAFAPYDDPQIAVSAVVEHGCSGSSSAAPIVRDVITVYMKKYMPALYKRYLVEDKKINRKIWLSQKKKKEKEKLNGL